MVLSSEILAVFNDKSYEVILDIGGDDVGAKVLGIYNNYLKNEDYSMYYVLNNSRPGFIPYSYPLSLVRLFDKAQRLLPSGITPMCSGTLIFPP